MIKNKRDHFKYIRLTHLFTIFKTAFKKELAFYILNEIQQNILNIFDIT